MSGQHGVVVYGVGTVSLSCCASAELGPEDVEAAVNRLNPTGIASPWRIAFGERFANGSEMPCPCEQTPGRLHYLLHC